MFLGKSGEAVASGMLVSLLTLDDILPSEVKILFVSDGAALGIVRTDTKLQPERGGATTSCVRDPDTILSSMIVGMTSMSSQSLRDIATGSSSGLISANSSSHGSDSINQDGL